MIRLYNKTRDLDLKKATVIRYRKVPALRSWNQQPVVIYAKFCEWKLSSWNQIDLDLDSNVDLACRYFNLEKVLSVERPFFNVLLLDLDVQTKFYFYESRINTYVYVCV